MLSDDEWGQLSHDARMHLHLAERAFGLGNGNLGEMRACAACNILQSPDCDGLDVDTAKDLVRRRLDGLGYDPLRWYIDS